MMSGRLPRLQTCRGLLAAPTFYLPNYYHKSPKYCSMRGMAALRLTYTRKGYATRRFNKFITNVFYHFLHSKVVFFIFIFSSGIALIFGYIIAP